MSWRLLSSCCAAPSSSLALGAAQRRNASTSLKCVRRPSAFSDDSNRFASVLRLTATSSLTANLRPSSSLEQSLHYVCQRRHMNMDPIFGTPIPEPGLHRMKEYDRLDSEAIRVAEKIAQDEEMQENELEYRGYTTNEVQRLKAVVINIHAVEEATEEDLRKARDRLQDILVEFCDSASGDSGLITRSDCHHIRFILSICHRRLGDIPSAETLLWDVLRDEPWNIDAVEGLLELCVRSEEHMKAHLLPFLNHMVSVERVDLAYSFLSDFIMTAASEQFAQHGEGATTNYIFSLLATLAEAIGPQHMGLMVEFLYNSFDEMHFKAKFSKDSDKEFICGLVVAFLKTLVVKRVYTTTQDPAGFEFFILHRLLLGLKRLKRTEEALSIGLRIIRTYRKPPSEKAAERLRNDEELRGIYRDTLFDYVNSRSLDSVEVSRQLCIDAIEEFPECAKPWVTLSAVLHRDNDIENAVIAAKKAVTLDPNDLTSLAILANLFEASGRRTLSAEILERYKLLLIMSEQNASEEDMASVRRSALSLDDHVAESGDFVETQFEDMAAHTKRLQASTRYSKELPTEPIQDLTALNLTVTRNPHMHASMGDFLDLREKAMLAQRAEGGRRSGTDIPNIPNPAPEISPPSDKPPA